MTVEKHAARARQLAALAVDRATTEHERSSAALALARLIHSHPELLGGGGSESVANDDFWERGAESPMEPAPTNSHLCPVCGGLPSLPSLHDFIHGTKDGGRRLVSCSQGHRWWASGIGQPQHGQGGWRPVR